MQRAALIFAFVQLAAVGVSHVAAPMGWVRFFTKMKEEGDAGVFQVGMMSLVFGSILVAFHNVWTWPAILVTLLGWAQVAKGTLYLAAPGVGFRMISSVTPERSSRFVYGGLLLLGLAAVIGWLLIRPAA